MLDLDKTNFVAYFPLPVRYGLTIGELAQLFNAENHIGADLHVIAMKNWHRNYFFERHRQQVDSSVAKSPHDEGFRSLPGIEILQNAGVSVGRGTETPFEEFGAPWLNGDDVAAALNERHLAGLHFCGQTLYPHRRSLQRPALRWRRRAHYGSLPGARHEHGHGDGHDFA